MSLSPQSGNLAYINHLTIVPALACIDDCCWPRWMRMRRQAPEAAPRADATPASADLPSQPSSSSPPAPPPLPSLPLAMQSFAHRLRQKARTLIDACVALGVVALSWPVVANMLQLGGRTQLMNSSFGAFRLVNTYGAFANVAHERCEPVCMQLPHGVTHAHMTSDACEPPTPVAQACQSHARAHERHMNGSRISAMRHQSRLRPSCQSRLRRSCLRDSRRQVRSHHRALS